MIDPLLDHVAQQLLDWGVDVVRGPRNQPGTVLDYAPEQYGELFGGVDAAMFSSRSRCPREVMLAAPRLRAIVNPTIGVETIDLAAADELGIVVANGATPENYIAMAEASVMLMLNLMYGLRETEAQLAQNKPRRGPEAMHARMLRGATIGLVGLGNIGRAAMHRLLAFDARLIAHSPHADPREVPASVPLVDLDTLLRSSDIVALYVAVTPQNRGLIGERALSLMKPSAFLVNVARGDAIDEPALIRALAERRIAGAALDTFAVEPLPDDSPLRQLDNVILTPHAVGHTRDGYRSLAQAAEQNFRSVLRGEAPPYFKNPGVLARWQARLPGLPDPYRLPAALASI